MIYGGLAHLSERAAFPKHSATDVHLPFLKPRQIPKKRVYAGEVRYGFSEDDELIEHALDELMEAMASKDHKKFMSALMALVHCVKNREDSDAPDSQQEA